ncbi:hypothetical protein F4604DRAFT_1932563 [Suillus subluteus]|nr:hypothetical protein F4604DRAFT_1932563 [Suillus subluteus]
MYFNSLDENNGRAARPHAEHPITVPAPIEIPATVGSATQGEEAGLVTPFIIALLGDKPIQTKCEFHQRLTRSSGALKELQKQRMDLKFQKTNK